MIVVADTSVILNLCRVEQGDLLPSLFGQVWITEEVRDEFLRLSSAEPKFQGLQIPSWAAVQACPDEIPKLQGYAGLHRGERSALALALATQADAILMDDAAGRRAAKALGLVVIGVAGILLQAKRRGLLPSLRPVIERLQNEAGFWLSPALTIETLRQAGET